MEIHKPHPVKSWKEFFIELGTVVLGILIALSLEQGVETWREHRQYREARQAMFDELSGNLTNIRNRQKYVACTVRRMQEIDALLDRAESGKPIETPSWVGDTISFRVRFIAESEAAKSGLFTSEEQRNFGSPYSYFHSLDVEQDRERQAWGRLRMLEGKSRLSPAMIQSLRDALADAAYENYRIAYLLAWTEAWSKQLGLKDLHGTRPGAYASFFQQHPHCLPMNTPLAEAQRQTAITPPPSL
ncbi:MAG: hypothetical protein JO256_05215 [Alphaproteobacteria bacterium]|nr:hypothetical protein [Alphaproteobacteria bacterium]